MQDTAYETANLLVAAQKMFKDHHVSMGTALLVRAEQKLPHVSDPLLYLQLTLHCDRLWRDFLLESELCPAVVKADAALKKLKEKV